MKDIKVKCYNHSNDRVMQQGMHDGGFLMINRHDGWYGISERSMWSDSPMKLMRLLACNGNTDSNGVLLYEGDVIEYDNVLYVLDSVTAYYMIDQEVVSTVVFANQLKQSRKVGNIFEDHDIEGIQPELRIKADRNIGSDMQYAWRNHSITRIWNSGFNLMSYNATLLESHIVNNDITYMYCGTGLTDSMFLMHKINKQDNKGYDLYEGDIVRDSNGWLGEIVTRDGEP